MTISSTKSGGALTPRSETASAIRRLAGCSGAGPKYEQQFKNTLRIHQVPVPVWYSAYPALSADNIENNAQIRQACGGTSALRRPSNGSR